MEPRSRLELANDNAAGQWLALAGVEGWETRSGTGWAAVRCGDGTGNAHQVQLTRAPADAAELTGQLVALFREWDTRWLSLVDPYGAVDLSRFGCERTLPTPVMVRDPGPVPSRPGGRRAAAGGAVGPTAVEEVAVAAVVVGPEAGGAAVVGAVEVVEAATEGELADVERVVVEGFPVAPRLPWRRGATFPAGWDVLAGRRSWLARLRGEPVGACVSWDDGASVGVYWVAVLPEHRSRGIARELMAAVLRAHPDRPAVLSATLLGEPLYRRLGFVEQGVATWWRYPGTGMGAPGPTAAP
ncbi:MULTISPECIES: GNAT family N-acetyltransferase [Streptacidiphilus]|uniref:GNAT family N-acetyltransferase n=1 Tax=Streptacidiphilus cavernicola TaxID=3342716 RepID=A0ABV6UEI8_9ACTN|nr:GNAT family N-acetyltransferase [Streptacidiphilus jeojiense]